LHDGFGHAGPPVVNFALIGQYYQIFDPRASLGGKKPSGARASCPCEIMARMATPRMVYISLRGTGILPR